MYINEIDVGSIDFSKENFDAMLKDYICKKLDQLAINYEGMHNLISCFLLVPEDDAGFEYIGDSAENARENVVNIVNAQNLQIDNFYVSLQSSMKPLWRFYVAINMVDGSSGDYIVYEINFDEEKIYSGEIFELGLDLRDYSKISGGINWGFFEKNLDEILS